MGFFKTPRTLKKKAKAIVDPETFASPGVSATQRRHSTDNQKKNASQLSVTPPLFHTVNDYDHQRLKNPKGSLDRRHSLSSLGSAPSSSAESSKRKLQISSYSNTIRSSAPGNTHDTTERFTVSYGFSPCNEFKPSSKGKIDTAFGTGDEGSQNTDDNQAIEISQLPFNESDSVGSFHGAPSCPCEEHIKSTNPQSPTGSIVSPTLSRPASFRSIASPKQPHRASSIRSTSSSSSLKQSKKESSFRSVTSPKQHPIKHSSFRSATSPSKHSSFQSVRSDDESCSYIEEYILQDDEYYEEEIIEEELWCSMAFLAATATDRKVMFDEFDEIHATLHLKDYSDQELKKSWYKRKDYDEMIAEARRVAQKDEVRRRQLVAVEGSLAAISLLDPQARHSTAPPQHYISSKSELEARGLEAWSPSGAIQVRRVKEAAIEAVWDEQNRQWENRVQDIEKLRQAYQTISIHAQHEAEQRGFADQLEVEKIRQLEEFLTSDEVKMKRRRASSILGKSKQILGKSVKIAGKVARETGKRGARAGVGAVTLDSRMLLEAIKIEKKKREAKKASREMKQSYKQMSLSARELKFEASLSNLSIPTSDGVDADSGEAQSSIRDKGEAIATTIKARADKLKLLGMIPIPGTKKMYKEDRREKKIEDRKRSSKRSGLASWEAGLAAEGKL